MRFSRWLIALLALLMLASACTTSEGDDSATADDNATTDEGDDGSEPSDDGDDDGSEPSDDGSEPAPTDAPDETTAPDGTDAPAELTASWTGVTEDTIRIGISMLDFPDLIETGLSTQGWGDQLLVWDTFVAALNERGGINGRQVEIIKEYYSPLGTDSAEAVCLSLTADNEVFAVIGGFLGPAEDANVCVAGRQETILIGGRHNEERLSQANAPWYESGSNRERRLASFLTLLDAEGMMEGRKIAVIGGLQAEVEYERAPALLAEFGIEPVLTVLNDAPDGDIPAQDATWDVLGEAVRSSGADTVLVIGSTSGNIRGIARAGLDVEIWNVDADGLGSLGESVTTDMADGVITINSMNNDEALATDALAQECVATFNAANPDIEVLPQADLLEGEEEWHRSVIAYCRWLMTFEIIATAAGPDLTHESFAAAAESLGDFALPGQPFNSLGPDKPDANDSFRLSVFSADAADDGLIIPLTDIADATP